MNIAIPKAVKCPAAQAIWSDALMKYAAKPEQYPDQVLDYDDNLILMKDKYPKSKMHLLIIPRIAITSVWELDSSHLGLLEQFSKRVELCRENNDNFQIQAGFHAIPSMSQLHLHINSLDYISPCLKNKKHYLSFTTPFFIVLEKVIENIQKEGKFNHMLNKMQFEDLLKGDLVCHKCKIVMKNVPTLKNHLLTH